MLIVTTPWLQRGMLGVGLTVALLLPSLNLALAHPSETDEPVAMPADTTTQDPEATEPEADPQPPADEATPSAAMDELPLAQCLPQQQAIQRVNQRPMAIRWLFLPYRGQLEVKHRRCIKQQSLADKAQLQALPGPEPASIPPRSPRKVTPSGSQPPAKRWWQPWRKSQP